MQIYSREELYELVWQEPVRTIAERIGVSDVALAKVCRKHSIPLPPRGHWAKIEAGKRTYRTPLPGRELGMSQIVRVGGPRWAQYHTPADLTEKELPPPPVFDETAEDLAVRVRKLVGKVAVPKDFRKAHRGITKLLQDDDERRLKYASSGYRYTFDTPLFDSAFERRRLRVTNAIIFALERIGAKVTVRGKDPDRFPITVGEQDVYLSVDHPGYSRGGWRTSSQLDLPASHKLRATITTSYGVDGLRTSWEDDEERRIESDVGEIVANTLIAAELQYRNREIGHHKWLVERKAQLIEEARLRKEEAERKELERLRLAEQARIERLLGEAAAFRQASDIRAYVRSVREATTSADHGVSAEELATWSTWALTQADRIDPVLSKAFLAPIE